MTKSAKSKTIIYKNLNGKLTIRQHENPLPGVNSGTPDFKLTTGCELRYSRL
jgi:hypothetical protein